MKTILLKAFIFLMLSSCAGQKSEIYSPSSKAISGYDPVAYFLENKPVTGNQEISYQ